MEYVKGVFEFRYKDRSEYIKHRKLLESIGFTLDDDVEMADGSWRVWYFRCK